MSRPPRGAPGASDAPPHIQQVWSTANPAHAIQRAAAVLSFPQELPSFVVSKLVDAIRPCALAYGLDSEEAVNSVLVQVGPAGASQAGATNQEGTSFQEKKLGQVTQNIAVTRTAIRFETAAYTRWIAFRTQLQEILNRALPILAQVTPVNSVGLEYVDFFFAVAEGPADAGLIIDNQSQLIARRAFRRRDVFHSHVGWFEGENAESRRVVNVDLSIGDAQGPAGVRRTITIRTFEAEQVPELLSPRGTALTDVTELLSTFDLIHMALKDRLAHLLTRDAKTMISLGG